MKKLVLLLGFCSYMMLLSAQPYEKISWDLQNAMSSASVDETLNVQVWLADQFDIESLGNELDANKASLQERAYRVITGLQNHAKATQAPLLVELEGINDRGIKNIQQFWIVNMIALEATPEAIRRVSSIDGVGNIDLAPPVELIKPIGGERSSPMPGHAEQSLKIINANKMWALGFTGQGVTVANLDTGVDGDHPALTGNWKGNTVPWDQAWYDYEFNSTFPFDSLWDWDTGHGSHTMGTMCGLDPETADTIGVAFGANWIAARWTSNSDIAYYSILYGFQWMLDPDQNPNTIEDMPAVVNNSWTWSYNCSVCPICNIIQAMETAGIAIIFAYGNYGPGPNTGQTPGKRNYTDVTVFSVGATDTYDTNYPIARFSSRGPTDCTYGGDQIKPEVSAPGVLIRSSFSDGSYVTWAGTSMACPHVCGAIALLKQAFPGKTGNELKRMLYETARDMGIPGEDNDYGMGLIDVYQAYIENAIPENPRPPKYCTAYSDYNTPSSILITWQDPSELVGGGALDDFVIQVWRDETLLETVQPGIEAFTENGLTDGNEYNYTIFTRDLVTDSTSIAREVSVFCGGSPVPNAPDSLSAVYQYNSVHVSWNDPTMQTDRTPLNDLKWIYVYRDGFLLDSVPSGIEQYTDPGPFFSDYTVCYHLVAADNESPCHQSEVSGREYCYIGYQPKILVWQGEQVWGPSLPYGDSLFNALKAYYLPVYFSRDLFDYGTDLSIYNAIFATFGTSDYCHGMSTDEGAALQSYVVDGGNLYLEGANCWWASAMSLTYDFLPWFGLNSQIGDGSEDLFNISGVNDLSGYTFQYDEMNVSIDELTPSFSIPVFFNPDNDDVLGVFYDDYGQGKAIGMVPAFAGLTDSTGNQSKLNLLCEYLTWFGISCNKSVDESSAVGRQSSVVCYPNPTSGISHFAFYISQYQNLTLKIYDVNSREVAVVADEKMQAGEHRVQFDASGLPAGIYFFRLVGGQQSAVNGKMVVVR